MVKDVKDLNLQLIKFNFKMNIKPIGNRILAKLVEKERTSNKGIILNLEDEKQENIVQVVAIGDGFDDKYNIKNLNLKIGDKILIAKGGEEIVKDGGVYKIIESKDILALIE